MRRPLCANLSDPRRMRSGAAPRRGVALLLVLIALGAAGAVTTFYLASRDNSAAIGTNAMRSARSEWAARSGSEFAAAVLQSDLDWIAIAALDGKLATEMTISGGTVSIIVTNMLGDPPTIDDLDLVVTAVSVVDGVSSTVQRVVRLRPEVDLTEALDPELREFGVFAQNALQVDSGGTLGVWPDSPLMLFGAVNKVGVGFTDAASLQVDADAEMFRSMLFVRDDAVVGLKSAMDSDHFIGGDALEMVIPAAPAHLPAGMDSLPVRSVGHTSIANVGRSTTLTPGQYAGLTARNSGVATLGAGDYHLTRARIENSGVLRIEGDVRLYISGDLWVRSLGAVEIASNTASLEVYLGGNLLVEDAAFGLPRAIARDEDRELSDMRAYAIPASVRVYGLSPLSGGEATPMYGITDNALVAASIHAPTAATTLANEAILVGRITASTLLVRDDATALYAPELDSRAGFTSRNGPMYDEDGDPLTGIVNAVGSFNPDLGMAEFTNYVMTTLPTTEAKELSLLEGGVTPRLASRARDREWPIRAKSLERLRNTSEIFSGGVVQPNPDNVSLVELGGLGGALGGG